LSQAKLCTPNIPMSLLPRPTPRSPLFPYTTLFRSRERSGGVVRDGVQAESDARRADDGPRTLRHRARRECLAHCGGAMARAHVGDRKSTRLNSSYVSISYAVFCLKKKKDMCNQFQI